MAFRARGTLGADHTSPRAHVRLPLLDSGVSTVDDVLILQSEDTNAVAAIAIHDTITARLISRLTRPPIILLPTASSRRLPPLPKQ